MLTVFKFKTTMKLKVPVIRIRKENNNFTCNFVLTLTLFTLVFLISSSIKQCSSESTNLNLVYQRYSPEFTEDDGDDTVVRSRRNDEIEELIPHNYDLIIPPEPSSGEPIDVGASILIFNVRDINEQNQDYNLEINLRLNWRDERLEHLQVPEGKPFLVLNPKLLSKIWTPDIFIDHVKNVSRPVFISKPASLRIYNGSVVRYSERMTIKMDCSMDFTYYPADTQTCLVDLRSFDYDKTILKFAWHQNEPPKIIADFKLASYNISIGGIDNFLDGKVKNKQTWVIRFELRIRRKLYFHILQTYLPSILFVIISWLSYLVPPENVSARTTVCMSTLLTLTTMFAVVRQNTPNESYAKALDVWMLACMVFVFFTLLEYAIVLKLINKKVKTRREIKKENVINYHQEGVSAKGFKFLNFERLRGKEDDDPNIRPLSYMSWYYSDGRDYVPYQIRRPKLKDRDRDSRSPTESPITATNHGFSHTENNSNSSSPIPSFRQNSVTPISDRRSSIATSHKSEEEDHKKEEDPEKYKKIALLIERVTLFLIPGAFVLFNIIYWPYILINSNYYEQKNFDLRHNM